MTWRTHTRRLGLGRAVYWLWHAPVAAAKKSVAAGGPLEQFRDSRAHAAMTRAAEQLTLQSSAPAKDWPELHFLTGKKFWDQTVFCLHSLQAHTGLVFNTVFHDDGSFEPATADRLRTLFPAAKIRFRTENDARVAALLPPSRFPFLHDRRQHYPNILKLTDIHVGQTGWRLVLDSDMLFFRRPDFVLNWLAAPDRPLHMVDVQESYGYDRALLGQLAGAPLATRVNVGFTGLQSDTIDWERLEWWCRRLIETAGPHYYLEQALVAMLVAGRPCAIAPEAEYVVLPSEAECQTPRAVLHHYVAGSKRYYFRHTWRLTPGLLAQRQ